MASVFLPGFDATQFRRTLNEAMMGTGGLTYNDVKQVKVAGWHEMEMAFRRGEIDVVNGVVGSPTQVANAQIIKGMRCISLDTGPEIAEHMKEILPDMRFVRRRSGAGTGRHHRADRGACVRLLGLMPTRMPPSEEVTELLTGLLKGKETMIGVSKGVPQVRSSNDAW